VIEGENGEQMEDEVESVKSSAEWFMQRWWNETGSWFQLCRGCSWMVHVVFIRETQTENIFVYICRWCYSL